MFAGNYKFYDGVKYEYELVLRIKLILFVFINKVTSNWKTNFVWISRPQQVGIMWKTEKQIATTHLFFIDQNSNPTKLESEFC